ncbi:pentatricopeptide repeat-containing protein At2g02750 [Sesamum indicum]|uniref:Pentatricopeptide repeat-containing protein At2g02750 n=1 Tax=Sesamum indicum TaxID=4182 RepID=A0A6I9TS07_SESIN|nr:pentatricopeptide repeat-containing protein At2g02750 [Sesamum indicum]XP_011086386.1 pentatricopeptide repeat-containing protein At2g02750 [Sesamum indicum]
MRHQIAKLVKDGLYKEAIALHTQHHSAAIPPTNFTFPYILKACGELKATSQGQMLHAHLLKAGYNNKHTTTDLTNMYMKLGFVGSAGKLFEEIPHPSVSILNVVISGFSHNGLFEEGFSVFKLFSVPSLRVDSVTVASVVSACGNVVNGVQVHCLAVKIGVERDDYAATSLMTMYLNYGELGSAARLFGSIENKNVVCYNAYLSGLVQNGDVEMVLRVFKEMRGLLYEKPTVVTMISVLSACGSGKCILLGRQLHGLIVKEELETDTNVGTGLVDMYSKCGSWQCAYSVFREMGNNRNLITWNSMIAGLMLNDQSENATELFVELECEERLVADSATWNSMISGFSHLGKADEAFLFFRKMLCSGLVPSVRCITSLLAACSSLSMQHYGKQIHAYVARMKITDDEFLATAIIDMYMKCGQPSWAYNVFNQFHVKPKDPAFWNAMISGYGRNGNNTAAFDIFNQMVEQKVKPNLVTFSCLLSVCSQTGLVDKGFEVFRLMTVEYALDPTLKHMNILIDLLSRSGRLDEAFELLQASKETSATVFASLLGASKHYSDSKLGEAMASRLLELEPENPIPFLILSNIYAGQEKWKDVHKIRKLMDKKGLKKHPGLSSVGVA